MSSFFQRHALVFSKTQITAAVATACDFLLLAFLVEVTGVHYVAAVGVAAAFGGVVNYTLNRHWTFQSRSQIGGEALRYSAVCFGSLAGNALFVWLLTEMASFPYLVSKAVVVALIGLFWNYPLHRYWVFSPSVGTVKD